MLGNLSKIVKTASELDWEKLVIMVVFLGILLGGYYGYRKISAIDFTEVQTTQEKESNDKFIQQFGKEHLSIDANIHSYLDILRYKTGADWVLFFGLHNGENIGPYHLKKISVIDESVERGNDPLYGKIQNIPMSLFSSTYPSFAKEDTIIVRDARSAPEGSMAELVRNGIQYEISTGIYLEQYKSPIGFIGIFYKGLKSENIKGNNTRINSYKKALKDTKSFIEYELNRSYLLNNE